MKYQSILIITYGRTGSTLLQGILNSIEGCLIRGENSMMCLGLYQTYKSILFAKMQYEKMEKDAWFGATLMDENYFLGASKKMVENLLKGDSGDDICCYGFKEIRYQQVIDEFDLYLDFLSKIFPDAAFVFNTRSHSEVLNSGWWKTKDKRETKQDLETLDNLFATFCLNNSNAFQLSYQDLIGKTGKLKALYRFLDAPYEDDKINQVLSVVHSYDPAQESTARLSNYWNKRQQCLSSLDSIALCITIKNEAALIRDNLLYHHSIGVSKVFLYLDESTDDSYEKISDLEFVEIIYHSPLQDHLQTKGWGILGGKIALFHDETHLARQLLNMRDAYVKAEKEGYDWLLCIDADELVYPCEEGLSETAFRSLLSRQPDRLDMLRFIPMEIVQHKAAYENVVFKDEWMFKTKFYLQGDLPGKIHPRINLFRKTISLPDGQIVEQPAYYGHSIGKVVVRTNRGLLPKTHHEFFHPKRKIKFQRMGYLAHYTLYSADDFIKKHLNFKGYPKRFMSGEKSPVTQQEWIKFINDETVSREEVVSYYLQNLIYSEPFIEHLLDLPNSPIIQATDLMDHMNRI